MPKVVHVWDMLVRLIHWGLVAGFVALAFLTRGGGAWHVAIGYLVAGLVALRLAWGIVGPGPARLRHLLPQPAAVIAQVQDMATGRSHRDLGHSALGGLMGINLFLTLAGLAVTGHVLARPATVGDWVKDLHGALDSWAILSVLAHVLGVVLESRRLGVNLARSMVTGDKTLP
jgi:cytochrome b